MTIPHLRPLFATLRLVSGLVLLFYVSTHFLNHSIGILGLETLERARLLFIGFWRSPLFSWVVPTSLVIHFSLTLYRLLAKRTFRGLRLMEWFQMLTGLLTPLFLIPHLYFTRIAYIAYGVVDSYTYFLVTTYDSVPGFYLIAVLIWIHGIIGLRMYLSQKPWYITVKPLLEAAGLLLPVLAVVGILVARREIQELQVDPLWVERILQQGNPRGLSLDAMGEQFRGQFTLGYLSFLAVAFLSRYGILKRQRQRNVIRVEYLGKGTVSVARGTTLLEASLQNNIPHAHVCGGRSRCSTCRVQVIEGLTHLSRPGEAELKVLRRLGTPPNVRLACQAAPNADCVIHPLLPPATTGKEGFVQRTLQQGSDKEIVILFADLRGFTALTEHKLPYDTVFILNQYFQTMAQAVEAEGGYLDKLIGDGIMVLFGLETEIEESCRNALAAAQAMSYQLDHLNRQLQGEIDSPLQLGIGVHYGHVIVGEMGYKHTKHLTAIGDAVNIASRLEGETKVQNCQLIVSEAVVDSAQADFSTFHKTEIAIRGRSQNLTVYIVPSAKEYTLNGSDAAGITDEHELPSVR
ncbi:MAG: adenylate/guanylate cyclase domain-containing protein [Ardenticatenales bacterium]|nr:adenylate/guanylate cyclase domain-containing protein [Ardenticatenales bacterium]